jgi:hypothetical protein
MKAESQTRIFIFLERMWLFAAVLGVACMAYFLIIHDNDSALFFFGFFVLSGLLYLLRKRQRVKHQNYLQGKSGK